MHFLAFLVLMLSELSLGFPLPVGKKIVCMNCFAFKDS